MITSPLWQSRARKKCANWLEHSLICLYVKLLSGLHEPLVSTTQGASGFCWALAANFSWIAVKTTKWVRIGVHRRFSLTSFVIIPSQIDCWIRESDMRWLIRHDLMLEQTDSLLFFKTNNDRIRTEGVGYRSTSEQERASRCLHWFDRQKPFQSEDVRILLDWRYAALLEHQAKCGVLSAHMHAEALHKDVLDEAEAQEPLYLLVGRVRVHWNWESWTEGWALSHRKSSKNHCVAWP